MFVSAVLRYAVLTEGELIGTVSDLFGVVLFECRAPTPGTVITIRHLARVEPGDALCTIAATQTRGKTPLVLVPEDSGVPEY